MLPLEETICFILNLKLIVLPNHLGILPMTQKAKKSYYPGTGNCP